MYGPVLTESTISGVAPAIPAGADREDSLGACTVTEPETPVPWTGPEWDDPALTRLAERLRDAHRRVAPLPAETRRRLIRHLLVITDLAKRDPELAARKLEAFLADFHRAPDAR